VDSSSFSISKAATSDATTPTTGTMKNVSSPMNWNASQSVAAASKNHSNVKPAPNSVSRTTTATSRPKSPKATKPTKTKASNSPLKKTAIVVVTQFVDDCTAARLEHLVKTAGNPESSHVWCLHNHKGLKNNTQRNISEAWLQKIPGLHSAQQSKAQHPKAFWPFDSKRSGSAKRSFLDFVVQHRDLYQEAWHLEDDVFFTGRWSDFFNANNEQDQYDVMAMGVANKTLEWGHWTSCHLYLHKNTSDILSISNVKEPTTLITPDDQQHQHDQTNCTEISHTTVMWSMLRVNVKFAQDLLTQVEQRWVVGHHEGVVGAFAKAHGYRLGLNEFQKVGFVHNGGVGKWRQSQKLDLENVKAIPGHLYHPVKCAAYESRMEEFKQQLIY